MENTGCHLGNIYAEKEKLFTIIYADILIFANVA